MTTQTAPLVPPRPSRSPHQQGLSADMPRIPPRPSRRADRSVSPLRDSYAPSPLNGPPNGSSLHPPAPAEVPQRPPSVTIPSLGEEGIEYEDLDMNQVSENHHSTPAETRNVGSDLKLHAPRPSLPTSSAKAQVQAVTRTDSRQAAAAGLGRDASPAPEDSSERPSRTLHSRASGSRADSSIASTDRRQSFNGEEHGIPEIGQRVPMYPNAGDVQAPSPSPYQTEFGSGSQRSGRGHHRSRSGRESSLPPGSYGLHGHGVASNDRFEKAWYEKHPEEYVKEEQGQYGPGVGTPRPDWALSSDDLNKIVRGSAVTGSGLGTSPAVDGTPEEEVGYIASDEYTQRFVSPTPDSRRNSRPPVESPLRNEKSSYLESQSTSGEAKEGVIHVDEPYHHLHHPDGFAQAPDPEEHAHGVTDGYEDEEEPILAADEVRPESAHQHPAVSPTFGRRGSMDHDNRSRTPSVNHSRSNSRTASHHGSTPALTRYDSQERHDAQTPLEDVEEYEPLFPDEETNGKKPLSAAERFKQRPDLKHRFPSQDIWEDSPNSLQLHATVSTPDESKHETFETPEQESFRRSHVPHLDPHKVANQILDNEEQEQEQEQEESKAIRPEIAKQRFPSRDIWEDAPESHTLVTTIEPSEEGETRSPIVPTKPIIPSRPQKRAPVDASTKPASPIEKRQPPTIPDRPKPQIPARPAKPAGLNGEENQDAVPKAKPAVPARPGGSKIAALKAGFLSDLNSRLQLGPQVPQKPQKKEDEPPAEKAPLSDARKGRARGPARRKPAVEPVTAKLPTIPEIRITESWNVWEVREDGNLVVGNVQKVEPVVQESPMAPPLSKNMAGEPTDPVPSPELEKEGIPVSAAVESQPPSQEPAKETASAPSSTETEVPTEPPAEPEALSKVELEPKASSSSESQVEDVAETLAASADGKRVSEGSVHE